VSESAALISAFLHGIAAGAMAAVALGLWRSSLSVHVRIAGVLSAVSMATWFITESPSLWKAMGNPPILMALNYPVAGLFWLFVLVIFDDWRVTPWTLAPAGALLVSGLIMGFTAGPVLDALWSVRNIGCALLALHAGGVIVRGWSGDLLEARRRFRALLLGASCVFVLFEVAAGFAHRLDPAGPWLMMAVGQPYGGVIVALWTLLLAMLLLQPRPAVFGAARRVEVGLDAREAADRATLEKLDALMAAEAWRREGLTIGDLARELETPEHRLRRLINQRLGHRNFVDFVNSHRLDAARRRLADPAQARMTVAAIAFDLGYGSLGPFNRAFRAATGTTPTDWRRQALAQVSPELKEAV
jgi:AraC-like DNA-binding protein